MGLRALCGHTPSDGLHAHSLGVMRVGGGRVDLLPLGSFLLPSWTQVSRPGSNCLGFPVVPGLPLVQGGGPGVGASWLQGSVLTSGNHCVKEKGLALQEDSPGKFMLVKESGKELPEASVLTTALLP